MQCITLTTLPQLYLTLQHPSHIDSFLLLYIFLFIFFLCQTDLSRKEKYKNKVSNHFLNYICRRQDEWLGETKKKEKR